jgi:hypothetical protein
LIHCKPAHGGAFRSNADAECHAVEGTLDAHLPAAVSSFIGASLHLLQVDRALLALIRAHQQQRILCAAVLAALQQPATRGMLLLLLSLLLLLGSRQRT